MNFSYLLPDTTQKWPQSYPVIYSRADKWHPIQGKKGLVKYDLFEIIFFLTKI